MRSLLAQIDLKKLSLYILGIAFFFCVAAYRGITTDATLYTIQAIHSFQPERFAGDITFAYGNQDSFTIFSPIYAIFLKLFSIELGAKIFCFISHLFFAIASIHLIDSWTKKFHCNAYFFPITLLFIYLYCQFGEPRAYINGFYYLETYVTPRIISIAFGLLGLAQLFKRKYISLFLFAIGTSFHPLMAGWGLPIWIFFHYPKTIIPITFSALLFPLTLFINKGPFGIADSYWDAFYKSNNLLHFFAYIVFFVYAFKFSQRKTFKHLSKAILYTILIAIYWLTIAQKTNHIFLNQVQTFRIEWICIATTFPLFCITLYEKFITTYRKRKKYKSIDLLLLTFPLAFWLDSIYLDSILLFLIFYTKSISSKKTNIFYPLLTTAQIICIVWILTATFIQKFSLNTTISAYNQNFEFYPALLLAIFAILKYIVHPSLNKLSLFSFLLILVCNSVQENLRFTENLSNIPALLSATFMWSNYFNKKTHIGIISLLWLIPFAISHYDHRSNDQIFAEKQIDYYFKNPLFQEITNRGSILFCVEGFYATHSRIQFLSGNYLDYQSQTGGLFNKQQYVQATHRFNLLFFKDSSSIKNISWETYPSEHAKLHKVNHLDSAMEFLCNANEISYLVTDVPSLTFPVVKKQKSADFQKDLFLYSCTN